MTEIMEESNNSDTWKKKLNEEMIITQTGTQQEIDEAYKKLVQYYLNYAPVSLYKYFRDTDLNLDNLKNNKLWFSSPCKFNDVFDCDVFVDKDKLIEGLLDVASENVPISKGSFIWNQLRMIAEDSVVSLKDTFLETKKTIGVSCFSELKDSLLMWSHYANNHSGFCVEYNILETIRKLAFTPVPVIYSNEIVCFDEINNQDQRKICVSIIDKSVSFKSPEWSYEREWRIIRNKAACGDKWDDNKKGALLDMIKPSSIILGCNAKPDFEQKVKEYCQNSRINLYKMEKDERQYKLNQKTIFEFDNQD